MAQPLLSMFIACWCISESKEVGYPNEVCFTGNVQAEYTIARDPRTLMGTYITANASLLTFDETIVDISAPIYTHEYQGADPQYTGKIIYLFKVNNIGPGGESSGWCLSQTLPITSENITTYLTCFEDDLFGCKYYKWWWGYNKYLYSIPTLEIMGNGCNSMPLHLYICI